jgi:hypothetical protein
LLCFKSGILDDMLSRAFFEVVQPVEPLFPILLCLASQMSRGSRRLLTILKFDIEASKRGDSTRVQRLEEAYLSKASLKNSEKVSSRLFGSLSGSCFFCFVSPTFRIRTQARRRLAVKSLACILFTKSTQVH